MPVDPLVENLAAQEAVIRFNEALNRGDIDAMMAWMTEDCIFENTSPAPDGTRYAGQAAVREFWVQFFRESVQPTITVEEIFSAGGRCILRWTYSWGGSQPGHVRGVDIYRIEQGKIAEKLSYVKG